MTTWEPGKIGSIRMGLLEVSIVASLALALAGSGLAGAQEDKAIARQGVATQKLMRNPWERIQVEPALVSSVERNAT